MSISSFRREGTATYRPVTLEGNWFEERCRLACGEWVEPKLMEGAVINAREPDISIAPPTRVPNASSSGKLLLLDRMRRSRATFDSSRQAADDGYRERTSINQTFFADPKDRVRVPISTEANFHGTFGGTVQDDDRTKTRVGPYNRSKNDRFEAAPPQDGDATIAKKMINAHNFIAISMPRPRPQSAPVAFHGDRPVPGRDRPWPTEFGQLLPRHRPGHDARMLESTAMTSWR